MDQDKQTQVGDGDRARSAVMNLARAAAVTCADVALLRREVAGEVSLCRDEVDALFAVDRALGFAAPGPGAPVTADDAWAEFFVRTVTDHIVWESRPTGMVSDRQAEWLLARVDEARTSTSFAILVNVLQEADRVPAWFAAAVRRRAVSDWPGLEGLGQTGFDQQRRAAA